MIVAKIFYVDGTQAVRLPEAAAFPDNVEDVEIVKIGDARVVSPVGERWAAFFENDELRAPDFERPPQPSLDERKE